MGLLRRLFGGETHEDADPEEAPQPSDDDADERRHELDLLRGEQDRLDELAQRQLRFADYAWQPPAQGGERRAEDGDKPSG